MGASALIIVLVTMMGICPAVAQNAVQKAGDDVKVGADKTADKTAEIASKGKAGVVDKIYRDKEGPKGETIYIDKHSKYYMIDGKGHKVYMTRSKLRNRKKSNG